ncbi:site-specific DNA-methyltransferase [Gallibacterium anatis]|uniref:site-specific DNA-methyltransferase (adenine-specific) n=1 Tax=Gallibacterium anatis TaxID=750 RepID=A0A1A7P113_9PAST|nr:site-specific DNA-methyltransferase [Gallibacterium anatis]OBW95520.1 DNA methylase N-4 [Gallibacterium anatis]OBX00424.1 DNA methylase N-4 [Gallibacterium anatis]
MLPEIFSEQQIDFEKFKQLFANEIATHLDRYTLNWAGKSEAYQVLQTPTQQTLTPCEAESVDFAQSQNVFIEGENLEVLKILQKSYFNSVKMIYIDPPYNTGNDFIYKDNFADSQADYAEKVGDKDEAGKLKRAFVKNSKENGHYHSNWLNMMLPRLHLARNLLRDDGVIFISIDDNEQAQLKLLCDEVFGEENFVATLHCQMSTTQGMKVKSAQSGNIVKNAEYILCYSKDGHQNIAKTLIYDPRPKYDEHYSLYLKEDGIIGNISELYDYKFPKDLNNKKALSLSEAYAKSEEFADIVRSHLADIVRSHLADIVCSDKIGNVDISDLKNGYWKKVQHNGREYLLTLNNKGKVRQLLRLKDSWGKADDFYQSEGLRKIRGDWWEGFYIDMGNVSKEGDIEFKNGKKPLRLIYQLSKMVTAKNDLILDFFAGSGTTAHAVMQLNAEDGGNRKFICVQLPEKTDETSEAFKAGFHTIAEISKERIRRAGKQIAEQHADKTLDTGFKAFKLSGSHFKQWQTPTEQNLEKQLQMFIDPVAENTDTQAMMYELLLRLGFSLTAKVRWENQVYWVEENHQRVALILNEVNESIINDVMTRQPQKVVMLDRLFNGDDAFKKNTELQMSDANIALLVI